MRWNLYRVSIHTYPSFKQRKKVNFFGVKPLVLCFMLRQVFFWTKMFSLTFMTQQNQEFMTSLSLHLNESLLDMIS